MRMDVTVTGPSLKGAAGLPPPIAETRHVDVTVNLHAKTVGRDRAMTITKVYLPDLIPSFGPKVITFKLQKLRNINKRMR